jgi:hypothetical protein
MNTKLAPAAVFAGMLLLVGCEDAKKTTADTAIKGAQTAYAEIADQADRFVPDQARDVRAAIQAAQDAFNNRNYSEAFEHSRTLPVKVKALKTATLARKNELTAQWNEMDQSMRELLEAIQPRVDALTKKRRLPKGVADRLASAKQTWTDASAAFTSGQLLDAIEKASAAKAVLAELQARLGIKPAA